MVATTLQPNIPRTSSASNSASTANAAQPSTLEMLSSQPTAVEQQRISDLQEQFQQQAQRDPAGFRSALQAAFGDKASLVNIDQLLDMALAGKLPMPSNIQFVKAGSLGSGALGAYNASGGGSLYLDSSLSSDPEQLRSVFNEEMGHHLDALLGGADAAGDEGAVFSRTLEQGTLSQSEITALKSEDDHGVIQIEGRWVQVEFHEEGGDGSGGDTGGDDGGGGTGGGEGAGSGGECSADSGSGSGGAGGTGSAGDDGGNDSGSNDTGGECGVGDGNGTGGTPGSDGPDDPDENTNSFENGKSDSDRAGDTPESDPTGEQADDIDPSETESGMPADDDDDSPPGDESAPKKEGSFLGLGFSGDVFFGGEIDLTGAFGTEFGVGLVLDLDSWRDSGFYYSFGSSGGASVGAALGGGYARGDIEGRSAGVDANTPYGSVQFSLGDDGHWVGGLSLGPGLGVSINETYTNTVTIRDHADPQAMEDLWNRNISP